MALPPMEEHILRQYPIRLCQINFRYSFGFKLWLTQYPASLNPNLFIYEISELAQI